MLERRRSRLRLDAGFTLVEVMVTLVLFGLVSAIAVGALRSYTAAADQRDLAQQTLSVLRATASRAVAEETTYCVRFESDGKRLSLWRGGCGTGAALGLLHRAPGRAAWGTAAFGPAAARECTFLARGSASGGDVTVLRNGSAKTWTVHVEGLTARVSYA